MNFKILLLVTIFFQSLTAQVNDTGDKIGIGVSNPQTKLHINVSDSNSELLRLDNDGIRSTSILHYPDRTYNNAGLQFRKNSTIGQFKFSNSANDLLLILPDGKITIKNSNPNSEVLELDNDGLRTTSIYNYSDGTYDNAGLQFKKNSSVGQFKFSNKNGDLLTILSTGNVGIGTKNPGSWKLAVNGKVKAKEIRVETTGWADYVFKKDYQLPTLQEVANHIKEKGHLINIPSEAEVAKNGIQLGEMNAKLLEKIEELTLYTLEQEKKLKEISVLMEINKQLEERLLKIERLLDAK